MTVTLMDIKESVAKKIFSAFPSEKIYTENIENGLEKPCFYIKIIPSNTVNLNMFHREKSMLVDIHYFTSAKQKRNSVFYSIMEQVEELFCMSLDVIDRTFTIQQMDFETVDKVLHCMFNLNYLIGNNDEWSEYPFMKELNLNLNGITYVYDPDLQRFVDVDKLPVNTVNNKEIYVQK